MQKFVQNAELRARLLATADARLAELSPTDAVWGTGSASRDPADWRGQNLLGKVLERVRAKLQQRERERKDALRRSREKQLRAARRADDGAGSVLDSDSSNSASSAEAEPSQSPSKAARRNPQAQEVS